VFWFSLQLMFETYPILKRIEQDMIKNVCWYSCKVPVILVKFQWNLNFLNRVSKNAHISNFISSCGSRVVPCGQTWQSFMLFATLWKAPKNGKGEMYAYPAMVMGNVPQLCRRNNYSQNTLLLKAVTNMVSPATYSQQCHRIFKYYVMLGVKWYCNHARQ